MRITATESLQLQAWSGRIADIQRLAELLQALANPEFGAVLERSEIETRKNYDFLTDEDLDGKIKELGAAISEDHLPRVTLSYRRQSATYKGTTHELEQVDTHDLIGIELEIGSKYGAAPYLGVDLSDDRYQATLRGSDPRRLVGDRAQLKEELERCKPAWYWIWTPRLAPAISVATWLLLSIWWALKLTGPHNRVHGWEFSLALDTWALAVTWGLGWVRKRLVPRFEIRDDTGAPGRSSANLRRIGWIVPVSLAIIGLIPLLI